MRPNPRKDSRGDILLLLLLIVVLLGGTALLNFRSRSKTYVDESIVLPRHVPDELVTFRETQALDLDVDRLRGLAIGKDDHIYVLADFRVMTYDPEGTLLKVRELDKAPHCASFGPDGKLYLGLGRRIGVMDLETGTVAEWPALGENALVASVAAGAQAVMVGDSGNRMLWVFDLAGEEITRFTNAGAAEGEGSAPSVHFDVTRADDDTFWCTDAGRHSVLHYSPRGALLGRVGKKGEDIGHFGGCCNPAHLAVFPDGRLLTVEKKPDLVKAIQPNGMLDTVIAPPSSFIEKTFLADAAVDSKGRVLVLDPRRRQVRIFIPKEES